MAFQGVGSGIGQQLPASTVERATSGMKSATVEDMRVEKGAVEPAKKNGYTSSSSSSSNSSNSSMGGKLLNVFKRKVHSPTGSSRGSRDSERTSVRDAAKEDSRGRNSKTQAAGIVPAWRGQSTVDTLEDELLRLRRRLELRDVEMQKLKSENSTLRKSSANGSVEPQPELLALTSVPHKETSPLANSSESFRSDASQLSCLEFSLAETGKLKFEGKIKTKITAVSIPGVNGEDQTDSILSDTAAVSAPLAVGRLSNINGGSALGDVRGTADASASSHLQLLGIVDKHVEGTKKSLDESKAEISKLADYPGKHLTAGGLKLPETFKGDLEISTRSYVTDREDSECFDIDANASRSPPSSTDDQDFTFPTLVPWTPSDSTDFSVLQKEASSMFRSTTSSSVHDEKPLKGPLRTQEEDSFKEVASSKATRVCKELALTIEIPPVTEDPLQMHMKSCVLHEVDKLSKAMKSLQREESLNGSKYPDRISRPTFLLPLPCSPTAAAAAAAQGPLHGGSHVPRRSLEWQSKAWTDVEQPRPVTSAVKWHEKDLESRYEQATEPMAGPNRFNSEDLPQPRSHRTSSFGTSSLTSPQCRDRATKTAEFRHELGSSESSSSPMSPSARDLSPSRNSALDESVRKPELGSGERVWQILSSALSGEHAREEDDIEEEVRQCLEQSRLLLMSDATSSRTSSSASSIIGTRTSTHTITEDKHSVTRPASRETSFSVLALSRQRRSMDKSSTSPRNRPEMLQLKGRPEPHEVASPRYVDHNKLDTQFGAVDITYPTVEAIEENDLDFSFSRPSSLGIPAEASLDKKYGQPSYEAGAWDSSLRSPLSLSSRRTRFFKEANSARFSQAA